MQRRLVDADIFDVIDESSLKINETWSLEEKRKL